MFGVTAITLGWASLGVSTGPNSNPGIAAAGMAIATAIIIAFAKDNDSR